MSIVKVSRVARIVLLLSIVPLVLTACQKPSVTPPPSEPKVKEPVAEPAPKPEPPAPKKVEPKPVADKKVTKKAPPKRVTLPEDSIAKNGGFEDGWTSWLNITDNVAATIDTKVKVEGRKSLCIDLKDSTGFVSHQWLPEEEWPEDVKKFRLKGYAKLDGVEGTFCIDALTDQKGKKAKKQWVAVPKWTGTKDWQEVDTVFELRPDDVTLALRLHYEPAKKDAADKGGKIWVDGISLEPVTE